MKSFDTWNKKKKSLENRTNVPKFREREIWWCNWGLNIGREIDGKNENFERPACVIKKFDDDTFFAIPITSKVKGGRFHHAVMLNGVRATMVLKQCRVISAKRLERPMGRITKRQFQVVKMQLANVFS